MIPSVGNHDDTHDRDPGGGLGNGSGESTLITDGRGRGEILAPTADTVLDAPRHLED